MEEVINILEITERLNKSWKNHPKLFQATFPSVLHQDDLATVILMNVVRKNKIEIAPQYKPIRYGYI